MQTIEEKKALLQRAIDDGLEIESPKHATPYRVIAINDSEVVIQAPHKCFGLHLIGSMEFRIVEPRITADDLAVAIEDVLVEWENERDDEQMESFINKAGQLSQLYREQESKTTNEVSEAGE